MNISGLSADLKKHCLDLEVFNTAGPKMDGMIETGLTLKYHTDNVINDALKGLDTYFETENEEGSDSKKNKFRGQTEIKVKVYKHIKDELETLNEEPLRHKHNDNFNISKKYFCLWKEKVNKKKEGPRLKTQQTLQEVKEEQIDKFIQGLKTKRKEKLKQEALNAQNSQRILSSRNSSSSSSNSNKSSDRATQSQSEIFQNRYKAQRDIILMQKSKLLEQEQKIHELQYGKICEELKESYSDSQNTIKNLLKKLSTRTKVVTGARIVEEPEEVQMKINKVPKLVKMMEERAQERALKRQIIQERKKLIDEEKKKLLEEQLEKKRIQDEEEKKQALDAIKERRKREVEDEKRKQAEREKFLKKCKIADKFYAKLLKRRALVRFKLAVEQRQNSENISAAFYETVLLKKSFALWRFKTKEIGNIKLDIALEHYDIKLKRKVLSVLQVIRIQSRQNMQVAIDYHAYSLQCKAFKAFYLQVNALQIRRYRLMQVAIRHYKTRTLVQAFYQWKSLPAILQLERAKEEKKRKWRDIVLKYVPEYKPPELF